MPIVFTRALLAELTRRAAFLGLLLLGPVAAWANDYYWVNGSGRWDDLSHWATSSGGPATYTQVPQSTDDVHFDANSFTASGQTVTINATVTCRSLDWTGAVHTPAGGGLVSGMRLVGSGTVEVNGDLRLAAGLGRQDANFRLLAPAAGYELDLQAVPINGWLSFESEAGGWTFSSDVNLVRYSATPSLLLAAGSVDFGSATVACYGVRSTGTQVRDIYLNAAVFNLLGPVNAWEVGGSNLTLEAGTSTIRLGATPRATANAYSFSSSQQVYNAVEVAAGASAKLGVSGSTFNALTVRGNATLTSGATITGALTVGPEAILRAASGQTLALAARAVLAANGSCAGLAQLQSSVPGQAAVLQRAGSWGSTTLSYAAVQGITFSGGGSVRATNSLNRGNNQNVTFSALPVNDLYWVGGSGRWHDASHWASSSGGTPSGSCLPTLTTNVHFDGKSFTGSGQLVTLDGPNAFCRDMDWTGAANAPAFGTDAADLGQKQLGIGGSLTLASGMSLPLKADMVFYGHEAGSPTATVRTAGLLLLGNLYFRAPGATYALLDALTLAPGATSPNGRIYVEAGTFVSNSQPITAQGFTSGYASTGSVFTTGSGAAGAVSMAAVNVQLGSSLLSLTPASAASDVGTRPTYTWDVAAGVTLDASSSTIRIGSNSTRNQPATFQAGLGLVYNVVQFTDPASVSLPTVVAGTATAATFAQLSFAGSANVSASNNYTQQLSLAAGRIYNFYNSTQTFGPDAQLLAGGDCSGYVTINGGTGTARVRFTKPTGGSIANQALQYAALRNATFVGGATWLANQSFDNGGNTGISFSSPPTPRTLYWVGGTGRWSDPTHWALTSGGTAGICVPNQLDDVVFDSQSFSAAGQVVMQDAVLAACRSLSWAGVLNAPTFSGTAANSLVVYGSLTWSPAMSQQLLGEVQLLGGGTLTSAGQPFGGALTLNAPGATFTLADALRQPRTGGRGLTLTAGTLRTNDQPVQVRSFSSNSADGTTARALYLGASAVEITNGAWTLNAPATLTFDAGTSTINLSTGSAFNGNGFSYNVVQTGAGATHTVGGTGSTFTSLRLAGVNTIAGSNTITQQLTLAPGSTYLFGASTTTTFAAGATVQANGTGAQVITLQSTAYGQAFTWSKPAGTVCASYIYLRDSQAQGGAYFEAGQNANNQGNTSGWSFASLPQASYRSQQVCPQLGAHTLRLTFAGLDRLTQQPTTLAAAQFPLTVVLQNLTTGTTETLRISSATYEYPVPTSTATTQYQVLSVATNPSSCTPLVNNGPFPVATDAPLSGPAGQWTGTASASWLNCQNWADGTVPSPTTDVTISAATTAPMLDGLGATVGTLRIAAGGRLTLGSTAELAVNGDWLNQGTVSVAASSQVAFVGNNPQTISGGSFGRVVVNNAAGLTLQSDASSATSLALLAGTISTGSYKWVHTNTAGSSLGSGSASSYVAGTLRRYVAVGSTDSYVFPVGTTTQYARVDVLSSQLSGTRYLEASFGPKADSDTGLDCGDVSSNLMRYTSLHPAGRWVLTPDAQPSSGTYAVRAYLAPFANLTDNLFAIIKRPDASASAADWTTGGGTLNANGGEGRRVADGYALRSGLNSFSQFGIGIGTAAAPLPVTLVAFQAALQGSAVQLTWVAAQELNLTAYQVERSLDGRSFTPVGQVAARSGVNLRYAFTDVGAPVGHLVYYRLRLIEPGIADSFSPVAAVQLPAGDALLTVWPTVVTSELHLALRRPDEDLRRVELLDAQGRLVFAQAISAGQRTATLPGLHLGAGLYIVRATTASHCYQQRVICQ